MTILSSRSTQHEDTTIHQVEIYTHPGCSYCHQAKRLLDARGISYRELDVTRDRELLSQMTERTGGRTLPQIIINGQAIGGFDGLHRLDRSAALTGLPDR